MKIRVGHGYDVHRLVEGRKLILGGVEIPYYKGLLGHSDADVLTHAVMDALLGAAAMGDIGRLFPDNDAQYHNANSILLLRQVVQQLQQQGYAIGNLHATIWAQAPKLLPYISQMQKQLAQACGIDIEDVNVKATTEEWMGFTGVGDGMAAHAVALIQRM